MTESRWGLWWKLVLSQRGAALLQVFYISLWMSCPGSGQGFVSRGLCPSRFSSCRIAGDASGNFQLLTGTGWRSGWPLAGDPLFGVPVQTRTG